jgi:hypothetical protein
VTQVSYDRFHPEVLTFFPNVPEIVVNNAIRNACIEFCDKTSWLVYTPEPIDLLNNVAEYDLTADLPSRDVTVARIEAAWVYELPLQPKTEADLRRIYTIDWRDQVGRPAYYTLNEPTTMVIVPRPTVDTSRGLELTLVLRPTRSSTTVDSSLFERWVEVIAAGARSRLHETPGHAYENIDAAMRLKMQFRAGIATALAERQRGLTRTTMRVRPPKLV